MQRWRAANKLHKAGVVSRAQKFPLWPPLAPQGEQKHLPDWIDTTAAKSGALTPLYHLLRKETTHAQQINSMQQPQAEKRQHADVGSVDAGTGGGTRTNCKHGCSAARPVSATPQEEAPVRDLNYALKQLCRRNRDGSYATQADREHILDLVADQLEEMGFRHMNAHSLKPKHVEKLVERWLSENLSPGTIKNRMTTLRWWAEKTGKENIVARTNAAYGIPDRVYVTNVSKAKELVIDQLQEIRTLCIRVSLRLQAAFGLQREESIKIVPSWADRGQSLLLKDSWTKGGRAREIPIRTLEQRQLVDEAKALAKGKSLVAPGYATYRDYLQHFRAESARVGIHAFHGHRHFYAQARYKELTGHECPARGGPTSKQLTAKQKAIDREARETISREMGHGRRQIVSVYCGR